MRKARAGAGYLLTAVTCAIVVTACGSMAAPGSPGTGSSASGPASSTQAAKASLDIQVSHGRGTAITHRTLRCQPAGGTEPDPARACRVLAGVKNPFGPLPKGIMCPMIIAGTKMAKVTGTWDGKPVNVTINDGGCWLSRWAKFGQIFN
jgi:Subtilisin inhibitor-like